MEVSVKQDDLFPDVITVVKDEAGVVVDLTGATIKFSMRQANNPSVVKINLGTGLVASGPAGKIQYNWTAGDTDTPGTYEGEFKVIPAVGDTFRVPTSGYITGIIGSKVGS